MLRLSCPEGRLTSEQLRAAAKIAAESGGGYLDVTTRGDLLLSAAGDVPVSLQWATPEAAAVQQAPELSEDTVGVHEQEAQPGFFRIGVPLLAGRITAEQLKKAADAAERYGECAVRLTSRQGLLFLNIPQDKVVNALEGLQSVDLKPNASQIRRGWLVCSETDGCIEGWEALSERSRETAEYLERQVLVSEPLSIRVSGRACRCARATVEQIALTAVEPEEGQGCDFYDVAAQGRLVARRVPGEEVKRMLERLLIGYKRRRKPGESLGVFCERMGEQQVTHLLEPA